MVINGVHGAIEVVDVDWRELLKDLDAQISQAKKQVNELRAMV